jgi:uncharacterized membrane protein YeaQ/YmgE (transglycosylase-associated protein family)
MGFGLCVGLITRLVLPGHHSLGWVAVFVLSLAGAAGGELGAEWLLPSDALQKIGYAFSALGALMLLLASTFTLS